MSASQPKSRGIIATFTSGLNAFVNECEKGITKATEEVNKAWADATEQRFRRAFSGLPADERLVGEYWGQCITGGKSSSCSCYVSTNYFSFVVDLPTGKAHVMIPLREIVNVQPAIVLRSSGTAPVIQPVVDSRAKADALQLYTRDMKLHQFFNFLHYDKVYHALLHAWQTLQGPQTYSPQGYTAATSPFSGQSSQTMAQAGTVQLDKPLQPEAYGTSASTTVPATQPVATTFTTYQQTGNPQPVADSNSVTYQQPTSYSNPALYPATQVNSATIATDPYAANNNNNVGNMPRTV
jgi:hypothetical protein